jgi:putative oxidoreductase
MLTPPATSDGRSRLAWLCLRVVLAGLIAAHGWMRFTDGGVAPFGEWLTGQHVPFGFVVAAGIAMVHARAGWFVVGAGGNGAEYSVLLIVCLLCVGLQHLRPRAPLT